MIRGLYDAHVLILVDSIRLSEQSPGGDHALSIDPSQVERVEVVRGPVSVLYGSEAIGGVINIITRKQRKVVNDGARFNGSIDAGYDSAANARQKNPGLNESKTPGYTTIDIRTGARIDNRLSVTVYFKNLTNKAYHDHLSRITPGNAPIFILFSKAARVSRAAAFLTSMED